MKSDFYEPYHHVESFSGATQVARTFVGMCDKNSKPIYDGDIIQFGNRKLLVFWNGEAFQWQAKAKPYPYRLYDYNVKDWDYIDFGWIYAEIPILGSTSTEVIGNIYQNADLLDWESKKHDYVDLSF